MPHKYTSRKYTRPDTINKEFVSSTTQYGAEKPKRLDCWKCKRKTPHTNGKCNWCGSDHEEELG